jgi:hypothetical protein
MRASLYLVAGMVGFFAIAGSARADGASPQLAMLGARALPAPQLIVPGADLPRPRPKRLRRGGIGTDPGSCGGSCPTERCNRNEIPVRSPDGRQCSCFPDQSCRR